MKVDISNILKCDGASTQFSSVVPLGKILQTTNSIQFIDDFNVHGNAMHTSGIIKVSGGVNAKYLVQCDRCLRESDKQIQIQFEEDFVSLDQSKDNFAYHYQGYVLDLEQLIRDEIFLELPAKQLCSEECKGFCSDCGINWNESSCQCKQSDIDSRFEKLKDFFHP